MNNEASTLPSFPDNLRPTIVNIQQKPDDVEAMNQLINKITTVERTLDKKEKARQSMASQASVSKQAVTKKKPVNVVSVKVKKRPVNVVSVKVKKRPVNVVSVKVKKRPVNVVSVKVKKRPVNVVSVKKGVVPVVPEPSKVHDFKEDEFFSPQSLVDFKDKEPIFKPTETPVPEKFKFEIPASKITTRSSERSMFNPFTFEKKEKEEKREAYVKPPQLLKRIVKVPKFQPPSETVLTKKAMLSMSTHPDSLYANIEKKKLEKDFKVVKKVQRPLVSDGKQKSLKSIQKPSASHQEVTRRVKYLQKAKASAKPKPFAQTITGLTESAPVFTYETPSTRQSVIKQTFQEYGFVKPEVRKEEAISKDIASKPIQIVRTREERKEAEAAKAKKLREERIRSEKEQAERNRIKRQEDEERRRLEIEKKKKAPVLIPITSTEPYPLKGLKWQRKSVTKIKPIEAPKCKTCIVQRGFKTRFTRSKSRKKWPTIVVRVYVFWDYHSATHNYYVPEISLTERSLFSPGLVRSIPEFFSSGIFTKNVSQFKLELSRIRLSNIKIRYSPIADFERVDIIDAITKFNADVFYIMDDADKKVGPIFPDAQKNLLLEIGGVRYKSVYRYILAQFLESGSKQTILQTIPRRQLFSESVSYMRGWYRKTLFKRCMAAMRKICSIHSSNPAHRLSALCLLEISKVRYRTNVDFYQKSSLVSPKIRAYNIWDVLLRERAEEIRRDVLAADSNKPEDTDMRRRVLLNYVIYPIAMNSKRSLLDLANIQGIVNDASKVILDEKEGDAIMAMYEDQGFYRDQQTFMGLTGMQNGCFLRI